METKERIDYKALCFKAPFDMDSEYEVNFKMLVYTEERRGTPGVPVVIAKGECKVYRSGW